MPSFSGDGTSSSTIVVFESPSAIVTPAVEVVNDRTNDSGFSGTVSAFTLVGSSLTRCPAAKVTVPVLGTVTSVTKEAVEQPIEYRTVTGAGAGSDSVTG